MSELQTQITDTIAGIRQRASEKRGAPVPFVNIEATSREGKPFVWAVALGWDEGPQFFCEVAIGEEIAQAVQSCIDKLKPVAA